ncbi:MAG: hypothetical protein K6U87_17390 [Firmicutes bacterium]|nr:hypothetical protein [Bacillota bacterium]
MAFPGDVGAAPEYDDQGGRIPEAVRRAIAVNQAQGVATVRCFTVEDEATALVLDRFIGTRVWAAYDGRYTTYYDQDGAVLLVSS